MRCCSRRCNLLLLHTQRFSVQGLQPLNVLGRLQLVRRSLLLNMKHVHLKLLQMLRRFKKGLFKGPDLHTE
jgi:hypothetical protein